MYRGDSHSSTTNELVSARNHTKTRYQKCIRYVLVNFVFFFRTKLPNSFVIIMIGYQTHGLLHLNQFHTQQCCSTERKNFFFSHFQLKGRLRKPDEAWTVWCMRIHFYFLFTFFFNLLRRKHHMHDRLVFEWGKKADKRDKKAYSQLNWLKIPFVLFCWQLHTIASAIDCRQIVQVVVFFPSSFSITRIIKTVYIINCTQKLRCRCFLCSIVYLFRNYHFQIHTVVPLI